MSIGNHTQSRFGHDGWDPPEDYGKYQGGGSSGEGGGGYAPYRFRLEKPEDNPVESGKPVRKRVMIISAPFYLWEHGTYNLRYVPRGIFNAICPKQNRIEDSCALCDSARESKRDYASYGSYFTVIDMGHVKYVDGNVILLPDKWKDKKTGDTRESQFTRKLMPAKKGGKDKPGMMVYFEDQRARRGDLVGCVYDAMRMGKNDATIGGQWEFVERVENGHMPPTVDEMKAYLVAHGADQEQMNKEWMFQRFTISDLEKACLFSNAELMRWVGGDSGGAQEEDRKGGTRTEGAGYGAAGENWGDDASKGMPDDDVPF